MEKLIEELKKQEGKLSHLSVEISNKYGLYRRMRMKEHNILATKLLEKIKLQTSQLLDNQNNLLFAYASLRYTLEALIQTKLLVSEPEYTYKLYYFVYQHQVDKTKKLIERLKSEISMVEELVVKEKFDTANIDKTASINIKMEQMNTIQNNLDAILDSHLTIFASGCKFNGYQYHLILMKKLLADYENSLKKYNEEQKKVIKDLKERLEGIFSFNGQDSQVFKQLEDRRSWETKAKLVNLEEEYMIVYERSSAIMHCVSYNIITPNKIFDEELLFILNMTIKYIDLICKNIKDYLKTDSFDDRFIIIELTE